MTIHNVLRALSSSQRRKILEWLADPRENFPPQVDGDLIDDGVCVIFIAEKLRVTQPTATEHLRILKAAGLVDSKRHKQWTFYKRNEEGIESAKRSIMEQL